MNRSPTLVILMKSISIQNVLRDNTFTYTLYRLFFTEPVRLEAFQWYTIMAGINGPPSANGTGGISHLVDDSEVRWEFMGTSHDTNGVN